MADHQPSSSASAAAAAAAAEDEAAPTRILLAVNQSSLKGYPHPSISSRAAFDWLVNKLIHAASHPRFLLLILHVQVPDEDGFDDLDSLYATNDDFKNKTHDERSGGLRLLQYFVNLCNEIQLPCKAWIKKGDGREVICKEVSRVHPDMLVVGSRGLGTIQRMFVGTISEYCTKHAGCPVLVIRRKPEDAPDDDSVDD